MKSGLTQRGDTLRLRIIIENLFGALAIVLTILLSPFIRSWYNRWGATDQELRRRLPGDERTPYARLGYTRAITIRASVETVWHWVIQMGYGKGGLYSYELLENLIGCDMHNADKIRPEFQHLQIGDAVRLGPKGYPLFKVVDLRPYHYILMAGADPKTEQIGEVSDPMPESYVVSNWLFLVESRNDGTTRLIVRDRMDYSSSSANTILWRVLMEPINFIMERKTLLGIKQRAEDTREPAAPFVPAM